VCKPLFSYTTYRIFE